MGEFVALWEEKFNLGGFQVLSVGNDRIHAYGDF